MSIEHRCVIEGLISVVRRDSYIILINRSFKAIGRFNFKQWHNKQN